MLLTCGHLRATSLSAVRGSVRLGLAVESLAGYVGGLDRGVNG